MFWIQIHTFSGLVIAIGSTIKYEILALSVVLQQGAEIEFEASSKN